MSRFLLAALIVLIACGKESANSPTNQTVVSPSVTKTLTSETALPMVGEFLRNNQSGILIVNLAPVLSLLGSWTDEPYDEESGYVQRYGINDAHVIMVRLLKARFLDPHVVQSIFINVGGWYDAKTPDGEPHLAMQLRTATNSDEVKGVASYLATDNRWYGHEISGKYKGLDSIELYLGPSDGYKTYSIERTGTAIILRDGTLTYTSRELPSYEKLVKQSYMYTLAASALALSIPQKSGQFRVGELSVERIERLRLITETVASADLSCIRHHNAFGAAYFGVLTSPIRAEVAFAKQPDGQWFVDKVEY